MSHETQERALAQRHAEKKSAWAEAAAMRDAKAAEARSLLRESRAIVDKAKAEKRAETAAEKAQLADLDTRYEALEPELSRLTAEAAASEQEFMSLPTSVGIRMPVDDNTRQGAKSMETATQQSTASRFFDAKSGAEIRAYAPSEKLADALELEHRSLSVGRWIQGMVTGKWTHAPREQRLLSVGDFNAGGVMVPKPLSSQIIDLARGSSTMVASGARTIPMDAPTLDLVVISGDPTMQMFGGDEVRTSGITESQGTFTRRQLQSQTGAILERFSIELAEDAVNFAAAFEDKIGTVAGLALDKYILYGSTAGARDGLRTWITNDAANSLNEVTAATNGDQVTDYSKFITAAQRNLEGNCSLAPEQMRLVMAPRTWGTLTGLKEGTTNAPLRGPNFFEQMSKLTSTQISITETQGSSGVASTVFLGDFSQVLIGIRTDFQVELSRVAGDSFSRLHVLLRLYGRFDFVVIQPKFLTRIIGLIP